MNNSYFPQYDYRPRIIGETGIPSQSIRNGNLENAEGQNFKQVLGGMVDDFNRTVSAPDTMLKDLMAGNKNVDYHDVMVAMSQAEITVNVATQVVGKVINAYDRVMQISI